MRVVIYTRVSSAEQVSGGYSLEAQEEQCRDWAAAQGHEVIRAFIEPGISARTDQRPAFQTMIQIVMAGAADAVLIHKSDRIARNLLDWLVYRDRLETAGKKILSVTEPFLNDDSAQSRMVAGIIGAVNEFYSANLSREVTKGMLQKAKSGSYPGGNPPLGYARKNKTTIIDPDHGPDITRAFAEFASGRYTLRSWAAQARVDGIITKHGNPISAQSWQKIFRNVFYTGDFVWAGERYTGDHPPLASLDIFTAVQKLLDERDSGGSQTRHFWLLSGLLWSTVHHKTMTGSLAKGKYAYYRATGDGPEHAIPAADIEARVIELLPHIRGTNNRSQWHLAMAVAANLSLIVPHLVQPDLKKFLNQIFVPQSLLVEPGGHISDFKLAVGFESL